MGSREAGGVATLKCAGIQIRGTAVSLQWGGGRVGVINHHHVVSSFLGDDFKQKFLIGVLAGSPSKYHLGHIYTTCGKYC